jgi:hypothetical protein
VGVGGSTLVLDIAATDSTGAFHLNMMIPPALSGLTFYTQGFIVDGTYFNTVLSSNVIGITFVP